MAKLRWVFAGVAVILTAFIPSRSVAAQDGWAKVVSLQSGGSLGGLLPANDGGFFLFGTTYSNDSSPSHDGVLGARLDGAGKVLSCRSYSSPSFDSAIAACPAPGGKALLVLSESASYKQGPRVVTVLVQTTGERETVRSYEAQATLQVTCAAVGPTGRVLLGGTAVQNLRNGWCACANGDGKILWQREFTLDSLDTPYIISAVPDAAEGFFVAGYLSGEGVFILHLGPAGEIQAGQIYANGTSPALCSAPGGEVALAFREYVPSVRRTRLRMVRLRSNLEAAWDQIFSYVSISTTTIEHSDMALSATAAGDFLCSILEGYTAEDALLVKVGAGGTFQWARKYPGKSYSGFRIGVCETSDGGLVLARDSPFQLTSSFPFIQKSDALGNLPPACFTVEEASLENAPSQGGANPSPLAMVSSNAINPSTTDLSDDLMVLTTITACEQEPSCYLQCGASVPATAAPGTPVPFAATTNSTGGCGSNPESSWDFGDGAAPSGSASTLHAYNAPGSYDWTLTTRAGGRECKTSGTIVVTADEPGEVMWSGSPGGYAKNLGLCAPMADGSCVVAGEPMSYPCDDIGLLRVKPDGGVLWAGCFSAGASLWLNAMVPNGDGLLLGGQYNSLAGGWSEAFFIRLSATGVPQRYFTLGGGQQDVFTSIAAAPDGSILAAGYTESFGAGSEDGWVIGMAPTGEILWQEAIGTTSDDRILAAAPCSEGGWYLAGISPTYFGETGNAWLVKIAADGAILWQKTFQGNGTASTLSDLCEAPGGGVLAVGGMGSNGSTTLRKGWMVRVDASGSLVWQKTFQSNREGVDRFKFSKISRAAGDSFAVLGSYQPSNWYQAGSWLALISPAGEILMQRDYVEADFTSLVPFGPDGFAAACNIGYYQYPGMLVKLTKDLLAPGCGFSVVQGSCAVSPEALEMSSLEALSTPTRTFPVDLALQWGGGSPTLDMSCTGSSDPCRVEVRAGAPATAAPGETVFFSGGMASYDCAYPDLYEEWDFGDGRSFPLASYTHAYAAEGSYTWRFTSMILGSSPVTVSGVIEVKVPPIPVLVTAVTKIASPFRLKVAGSNFHAGCSVRIDGTPAPTTVRKSDTSLTVTGGAALKAMIPKGATVLITVFNPDDGSSSAPYPFRR